MIYVFCCRTNSCLLYKPLESVVALRAQLPRINKYYVEIQKADQNEQYTDYKRVVDSKKCRLTGLYGYYRCGGCQIVHYCSPEYQKEDWNNGHSDECKAIVAARKSDDTALVAELVKKVLQISEKNSTNIFFLNILLKLNLLILTFRKIPHQKITMAMMTMTMMTKLTKKKKKRI